MGGLHAKRLSHQQDCKDADGGCGCQCFGDLLPEGVLSMICALQWALLGDPFDCYVILIDCLLCCSRLLRGDSEA